MTRRPRGLWVALARLCRHRCRCAVDWRDGWANRHTGTAHRSRAPSAWQIEYRRSKIANSGLFLTIRRSYEHRRLLPLVGQRQIEHAIFVQIDRRDRAGVEDLLIEADFFAAVGKDAFAVVLEITIRSLGAANQQIHLASPVEIRNCRTICI